eukprot:jgi/Psemu1/40539/gm1.40539_g
MNEEIERGRRSNSNIDSHRTFFSGVYNNSNNNNNNNKKYLPQQQQQEVLFLDPSVVSFWMHQCVERDEIEDLVKNTNFPGRDNNNKGGLILVPVNDTMVSTTSGDWKSNSGTHWSLLVVDVVVVELNNTEVVVVNETQSQKQKQQQQQQQQSQKQQSLSFWHFDSIRGSGNLQAARDIAERVRRDVYPYANCVCSGNTSGNTSNDGGYDNDDEWSNCCDGGRCNNSDGQNKKSTSTSCCYSCTTHSRRLARLEECLERHLGGNNRCCDNNDGSNDNDNNGTTDDDGNDVVCATLRSLLAREIRRRAGEQRAQEE